MKKFLTVFFIVILTATLLGCLLIIVYHNVPAFADMADQILGREPKQIARIAPAGEMAEFPAPVFGDTETQNPPAAESAPISAEPAPAEPAPSEPASDQPRSGFVTLESEIGDTAPGEAAGTDNTVYEQPDPDTLEVPGELKDRTGFTSAEEVPKTVTDAEAAQIEAGMPMEPVGDDLSFDPLMYPYYAMLSDTEQKLYRQIYSHAKIRNAAFRSAVDELTSREVQNAFLAVYFDHPELYWLDNQFYTFYRRNGNFIEMDLVYNETAKDYLNTLNTWGSAADGLLANAAGMPATYDKEKALHNALAAWDEYSLRAPLNQSAYSAVVNQSTVCAGYARAFQYLMQQCGIPCYFCAGYAGEPHAWNIVCLDGDYYNVDVTWDDTGDERIATYDWFNRTDADFATTHLRQGLSINLPPCGGTRYRGLESGTAAGAEQGSPLPTLADAGFTPDDVLNSPEEFYDAICREITDRGFGSYSFSKVIDAGFYSRLYEDFTTDEAKERVLRPLLESLGGSAFNCELIPTELADGYVLIESRIALR